jgi:hypothetical protein
MVLIPVGGQTPPILNVGERLEWKNAQKKAKKNIISEIINKTIPSLRPLWTIDVCCSSKVASLIISLHQAYITNNTKNKPVEANDKPPVNFCIDKTKPAVNMKTPKDAIIGHGLGSTKWKECLVFM